MASISYENVFNQFLGEITDHNLPQLSDSDADELMVGWLHKAVAEPLIRKIFSSFSIDDGVQRISYEMKDVVDEQSDELFVTELLAKQMAYNWSNERVKSDVNTNQFFSGKEVKSFSQANHMEALRNLKLDAMNDVRRMIGDRSIGTNSYLGGS